MQIKNIWGGALFATRTDTADSLLPAGRAFVPEPYKQRPLCCVAGRNPFFNFLFFIPRGTRDGMFSHPRKLYEEPYFINPSHFRQKHPTRR